MLLWKNYLLKSRMYWSSLATILLPLVVVLLLTIIRAVSSKTVEGAQLHLQDQVQIPNVFDLFIVVPGTVVALAIVTDSGPALDLFNFMQQQVAVRYGPAIANATLVPFPSVDAMNDYVQSSDYGNLDAQPPQPSMVLGLVLYPPTPEAPKAWGYSIRANASILPQFKNSFQVNNLVVGYDGSWRNYYEIGWVPLQLFLDRYITAVESNTSYDMIAESISSVPFPVPEFTNDLFMSNISVR